MKIRKPTPAGAVLAGVVLVLSLGLVPAAFAGKSGGGGGKHGGTTSSFTGTFSKVMVSDANGDGLPNWNDQITFKVSSNAAMPMVNLTCYQGTTQVDNQNVGFYYRLAVVTGGSPLPLVLLADRLGRRLHRHPLLPGHQGQRDARDDELPRRRLTGAEPRPPHE